MDNFEEGLVQKLRRHQCPTPFELGEYHLAVLEPDAARRVAAHVRRCAYCKAELASLQRFLEATADPEPAATPSPRRQQAAERLRLFLLDLLNPPPQAIVPPALGLAWRGDDEGRRGHLYRLEDYLVSWSAEPESPATNNWALVGAVVAEADPEQLFPGWQAHLWQAARHLESVPMGEEGSFLFSRLAAGSYELILSGPSVEIHLQNLHVG